MRTCNQFIAKTCCGIAALFSSALLAQKIAVPNANFEESDGAGWAKNWSQLQHAGETSYRFTLDDVKPFSGKYSGKIEQIAPQIFGLFKQRLDARPYVGKRVSIRAQAKAQGVGENGGGLYVRIDGPSDAILGNDFESGNTRGSHDWKPFRAVVEIPPGAVLLEFGIMLQDKGAMWADEFVVEVTTDPITRKPPVVKPDAITFDSIYKNPPEEDVRRGGKVLEKKP